MLSWGWGGVIRSGPRGCLTSILHTFCCTAFVLFCSGWGGENPACCASAVLGSELSLLNLLGKGGGDKPCSPGAIWAALGLVLAVLERGTCTDRALP